MKPAKEGDVLKSYFILENFFEKYSYLTRPPRKTERSKTQQDREMATEMENLLKNNSRPARMNAQQRAARIADEQLWNLQCELKQKKLAEEEKNKRDLLAKLKVKGRLMTRWRKEEENDKTEEEIKNEASYLKSGFSMQEIRDFEPPRNVVGSMLSLDDAGEEMQRIRMDLALSKSAQKRIKQRLGLKTEKEGCLTTCSERAKQWKCRIF